ncbi:MAG TPA: DUF3516 domain-containing protein, partial [Polyangiaceae bacterium]|nr:DUF3516 domain-containing protein [Polyangiaceae bacterium]
ARFEHALAPFFAEHAAIRLDPSARTTDKLQVEKAAPSGEGKSWRVLQTVCDVDGHDDWFLTLSVPLARSAVEARPVLVMGRLGR